MKNTNLKFDVDDLVWSSICYMSGEFDEASEREFEKHLAEQTSCRKALDQAIEMMNYVYLVEENVPEPGPAAAINGVKYGKARIDDANSGAKGRSLLNKYYLVAGSLAACLVFVASVMLFRPHTNDQLRVGQSAQQDFVALAWSHDWSSDDLLIFDDLKHQTYVDYESDGKDPLNDHAVLIGGTVVENPSDSALDVLSEDGGVLSESDWLSWAVMSVYEDESN
ncbi:MAG TPA: hypothetical protein PKD64_14450 [Pirellulaceae bacterium]|nr:hypothetical protein [Pirellulaceae bacterium]HMO93382.1 hypothetical protein [Pirellulaceae bacterium]HMP70442.1 hypothetical protein [Pirellulaceae bacterium]